MFDLIWDPIITIAAILLCSLVVYGLIKVARRSLKPNPTADKEKNYACGEELKPEEMHADSGQFFSPVRRVLKPFYRYVQTAHTGSLNTYLLWVVVGFIIILAVVLLTVR